MYCLQHPLHVLLWLGSLRSDRQSTNSWSPVFSCLRIQVDGLLMVEAPPRSLDLDRFGKLSPKHQTVARCIAENPAFAAFATAAELGERAGVSAATVVRFAQALGFNGYNELQQNARHEYLRTLRPL